MVHDQRYLDASAGGVTYFRRNSPRNSLAATKCEAISEHTSLFWLAAAVFRGDPSGTRTHNPLIKSHSTALVEFRIAAPFLFS